MVDRLAQGQPLTYDYLADIEGEIESLKTRLTRLSNRINNEIEEQNITVLLDKTLATNTPVKPNNIQVIAATIPIQFSGGGKKAVLFDKRNFDRAFSETPIVVASLSDPQPLRQDGSTIAMATITIGHVSPTLFNYKVEMIRSNQAFRSRDLYLNYIAIGKR